MPPRRRGVIALDVPQTPPPLEKGRWSLWHRRCHTDRRSDKVHQTEGEHRAMLSAEQNELITRTGPGTSAGTLLRRYWQPAALVDELAGNRPVKPVRLLGEDLVLFRDTAGRYGLLERSCPHRGTDLAFGRLEGS